MWHHSQLTPPSPQTIEKRSLKLCLILFVFISLVGLGLGFGFCFFVCVSVLDLTLAAGRPSLTTVSQLPSQQNGWPQGQDSTLGSPIPLIGLDWDAII